MHLYNRMLAVQHVMLFAFSGFLSVSWFVLLFDCGFVLGIFIYT